MIESWEKILDPNFINAELIGPVGSERVVTIKDIDYRETYNQRKKAKEQKQCLILEECKPMVLNKTNTKTLIRLFGSENPAACVGQKIVLYVADVPVAGDMTTGIRIREHSESKCDECGKIIKPAAGKSVAELIDISKRNTGRTLCLECMKKAKEKMNAEQN